MSPNANLIGQRFNRWTVLGPAPHIGKKYSRWFCRCDCGAERIVDSSRLKSGLSKSCGCGPNPANTIHGKRHSRAYESWSHAKGRCHCPTNSRFKDYGARGIIMCERWRNSFKNFLEDMGEPLAHQTLERLDNSKGYEPGNCVWADRFSQANNARTNIMITYRGGPMTLANAARYFGVGYKALHYLLRTKKFDLNQALKILRKKA